jgi:hypothetical protein
MKGNDVGVLVLRYASCMEQGSFFGVRIRF